MHILLVASAYNSLTQRVHTELAELGHTVAVELALGEEQLRDAVRGHAPELIVAPMLTTPLPADVHTAHTCLVVHPGPPGDRGPSALDRALQEGVRRWGVTVLEAEEELDAGPVWASEPFGVPEGVGKSDLYRGEVADAAVRAVVAAVDRFACDAGPLPDAAQPAVAPLRPFLRQRTRRIDWRREPTESVLRKLRAADSQPGVLDELCGVEWYLHGGHPEEALRGRPGELLATRDGAVCRATADGAVWIPQLRPRRAPGGPRTFRLPAVQALGRLLPALPEPACAPWPPPRERTWREIRYEERGAVGFLRFAFPGGAVNAGQARRLLAAYRFACTRPTQLVVLGGERGFFCNGIDLNTVEADEDPAAASWGSVTALNDVVEAVLTTTDRLTVAALGGNAAAGGVMLALAADEVWCRSGTVLNPHYRLMGLHGSEYWTYVLPRRVGAAEAERLTSRALPVGTAAALRCGLADRVLSCSPGEFAEETAAAAAELAGSARFGGLLGRKKAARERDEAHRPLSAYREAELTRMRRTFFDPAAPYHALRSAFVRKLRPERTPRHLAGTGAAAAGEDARPDSVSDL